MMEIQIVQDLDAEENEEAFTCGGGTDEDYSHGCQSEQPTASDHLFAESSADAKLEDGSEDDFVPSYIFTAERRLPAEREDLYSDESGNISVTTHPEEMPQILQSSIMGAESRQRRPIITIINDCNSETSLQRDDGVSKDVLKRFVIDSEGIHPSLPTMDVDSPLNSILQANQKMMSTLPAVATSDQTLGERKQHRAVMSTMMTAPTMSTSNQQSVTIDILDNTVGSMFPTVMEAAPDVMEPFVWVNKSAPDKDMHLDLMFEVVAEITAPDGQVFMREITTQTSPVQKESRKRKRKSLVDSLTMSTSTGAARTNSCEGQNRFSCTNCSLKFINADTRDAHVRCHRDMTKNYHCYFCDFTSTQWTRMHQHLFKHGVEKPHKCDKCSFTCKNKSDLAAHMTVHSDVKQFSCSKCQRMFKHRRNVVAHQRSCSGIDESGNPQKINGVEKFVCNICKRELSTKKNLDKHMEIHLELKPYVCDQCGHATRLKESLVMHKRLHTGEKPYKCDVCDYATPDKSSLRRHKRTHTNERPYKCSSCNYSCIQKHCLDTHVRRKHTGEQFVCGLCHYATHDRYGLNQHFKRHQNGDGTIVHEIQIVEQEKNGAALNTAPFAVGTTYIGLPSGAMMKTKEKESGGEAGKQSAASSVVLRLAPVHVGQVKEELSTLYSSDGNSRAATDGNSQRQDDQRMDKGEVATVELGQLEASLLQQIQQPGDEIFVQTTGEIVIRRQDGHLLVIQRQEIEEDDENATEEDARDDTQEYFTAVAPSDISNSRQTLAGAEDNDSHEVTSSHTEETRVVPAGKAVS